MAARERKSVRDGSTDGEHAGWGRAAVLSCVLLAAATFTADALLPAGAATPVLYVLVVLIALRLPPLAAVFAAISCSALAALAVAVTPPREDLLGQEVFNRALALGAIWTAAVLGAGRRRARIARKEQTDWYVQTLTGIGDGVIATDARGRVCFMNPAAERLTARTVAASYGRNVTDVLHLFDDESGEPLENPVRAALREGRTVKLAEGAVLEREDSTRIAVSDAACPLRDTEEELSGAVLVFQDVTERRHAARALAESERRFRLLADSLPQVVWTIDTRGRTDYFNRGYQELLGAPEAGGSEERLLAAVHPEDRKECEGTWRNACARGHGFELEYRLRDRRTGQYRWHLGRAVPLKDDAGNVERWFATSTDIHELKAGQELREKQALELETADQRKNEFLAILGHELRNPLAGIDAGVRLLEKVRDDEARFRWVTEMLRAHVEQLSSLVDDLLDLTRISRGQVRLEKRVAPLSPVVARAIESARPMIETHRHELVPAISHDVVVDADPIRVEQIIVNLLTNAARYTQDGGRIEISCAAEQNEAVIRVKDTGIGIPLEMQAAIFNAFQQVRQDSTSRGGLGIGLTIVKRLTELHGGSVSVASEGLGKGSEFTVRLPLAEHPRLEARGEGIEPAHVPKGLRVLVVEDDESTAQALAMLLEGADCSVETVADGASALRAAQAFRPDAMLIDLGLPDMSGHELARQFRSDPHLEETLLIAVSGFAAEEVREASIHAGFQDHLAKPADLHRLLELLSRASRG